MAKTVLVIEAHARAAIAIIKSFLRHGINVVAASDHYCCVGFFVHGLRNRVIYPSVENSPGKFIDWLMNYLCTHPTSMLLPLGDVCVELIARYQHEIRKHTLLFMPDYRYFMTAYDKIQTNKVAEAVGIPIPRCWYPDEVGLDIVLRSVSFPVVVKPAIGVGGRGIIRADSPCELEKIWVRTLKSNTRMFVQEFVPITGRQYVVDTLTDTDSRTVAAVASEKVRFYPLNGGASTLSRSVRMPELCEIVTNLLRSIRYHGIGNTDFIEDPRDGVVKLLEVNPRFGEMHSICNAVGIDMPYLLFRVAAREVLPVVQDYPEGKYIRFLPTDMMWFLKSAGRFRAVPGLLESFSSKVIDTLFEDSDYGPLIGYAMENIAFLADPKKFCYRFMR